MIILFSDKVKELLKVIFKTMVKNIFRNLPNNSDKELFENIFERKDIVIERIASYGNASPENFWYNQSNDEWVVLLCGEAEIEFKDNKTQKIVAGDYLFIPSHQEHRVSYVSKEPNCIWLAIHFNT